MPFYYRPEVLEELLEHGVQPRPTTAPQLVMDYLNDLYRYELRRLRDRLLRSDIARQEYSMHVVALRKRYLLVSVPVRLWTSAESPD